MDLTILEAGWESVPRGNMSIALATAFAGYMVTLAIVRTVMVSTIHALLVGLWGVSAGRSYIDETGNDECQ